MARDLDELRATLAKVPTRAPWSAYLRKNFPAFEEAIKDAPKDWAAIAAWALEKGHTGGKPITAIAARRAYDREYARRHGKRRRPAAPVPTAAPQSAVEDFGLPLPRTSQSRYDFKPGRLKRSDDQPAVSPTPSRFEFKPVRLKRSEDQPAPSPVTMLPESDQVEGDLPQPATDLNSKKE